jgi:hypothetical protein
MRILFRASTLGWKSYHSFAKRMKELIPDISFGVEGGLNLALDFFKKQNDIDYWIFEKDDSTFIPNHIDFDMLREFEENLQYKSLWRVISGDRGLGRAFLHGAIGYDFDRKSDQDQILRSFIGTIIKYQTVFDEFKPDIYIPAIGMGDVGTTIKEEICKKRNILYMVPSTTRIKNYFSFSDNIQLLFPQIDGTYSKLIKDYNNNDTRFAKAKGIYSTIMNDLENPDYFDRRNSRFNIVKFDTPSRVFKWFIVTVLGLLKIFAKNVVKKPSIIFNKCRYYLLNKIQHLLLTSPKFCDKVNLNDKYIYYTLHCAPEYSINIQGTMWLDQLNNIELLAKSIPADWNVYVKEHPGTLVARVRPINFFKKIKELPNVRLLPIDEDMHQIISNAEMVAVVVGTAGLEAVLRGIPTISFADNSWDVMGLSTKCTDIESLSVDIINEIKRISKISITERKKRIICFLAAVLEHSFHITHPNELVYTEIGTDEQYEVCGREMADGLVKHLDYLQKEKGYSFGIH